MPDQLSASEELQQINDELEKQYVFALKKVECLLWRTVFLYT